LVNLAKIQHQPFKFTLL